MHPVSTNEFRITQQGYTCLINDAWRHDRKFYNQATLQVLLPFSLSTHRPAFRSSSRMVAGCQTIALGSIPLVAASHRCLEVSPTTTHQKPARWPVLGILIVISYANLAAFSPLIHRSLTVTTGTTAHRRTDKDISGARKVGAVEAPAV